ncbi:inactive pancreatic lipase-related protein 1-like [Bacillus rossius redtenbacheri]|uniref:inactive pancreatic lipase-related protein 1-like n=1 Tax=Bacillus rossius redtenbacheri TaxID=93214 RepID=UPI002FDCA380
MTSVLLLPLTAAALLGRALAQDAVCYDGLPCFPMTPQWSSPLRPVPAPRSPAQVATSFTLFTRSTQYSGYNVTTWPHVSVDGSDYEGRRRTTWVVQGASSSWNQTWMNDMKNKLLAKEDCNVVLVVWGKGDPDYNFTYPQAVADTRLAGAEMARVGRYLIDNKGASASDFHVIGFSLGGQIAGYMGKELYDIGRITALDPSDAGFENFSGAVQLHEGDARLVEVVHTSIAPALPPLGAGSSPPAGHVDFYLNGGKVQPGCNPKNYSIQTPADFDSLPEDDVDEIVGCSHGRSVDVYLEAISRADCAFCGRRRTGGSGPAQCSPRTCRLLGRDDPRYRALGVLDLVTGAASPYCIGDGSNNPVKATKRSMKQNA